jgi:hypothetical protein
MVPCQRPMGASLFQGALGQDMKTCARDDAASGAQLCVNKRKRPMWRRWRGSGPNSAVKKCSQTAGLGAGRKVSPILKKPDPTYADLAYLTSVSRRGFCQGLNGLDTFAQHTAVAQCSAHTQQREWRWHHSFSETITTSI